MLHSNHDKETGSQKMYDLCLHVYMNRGKETFFLGENIFKDNNEATHTIIHTQFVNPMCGC